MNMTYDELLDYLAINYSEWPKADFIKERTIRQEANSLLKNGFVFSVVKDTVVARNGYDAVFGEKAWKNRREELLNKPSWEDAPDWANWLAQNKDGRWFWYDVKPALLYKTLYWINGSHRDSFSGHTGSNIKGHDWRDTLEASPKPYVSPSCSESTTETLSIAEELRQAAETLMRVANKLDGRD